MYDICVTHIPYTGIRVIHTGCIKKVGTLEYFEKYKFYQKMFQTKVVGFKKFYLLAISF